MDVVYQWILPVTAGVITGLILIYLYIRSKGVHLL